jgi:hypothetical protein
MYCYAIRPTGQAAIFATSHDVPVFISGLPAAYDADDPQEFIPMQIAHGIVERKADFDRAGFDVTGKFDLAALRSYFVTVPASPLRIDIIRVAASGLEAAWGVDTYLVQSGVVQEIANAQDLVTARCLPVPYHMEAAIPRVWFNRTCQWPLYGQGCGVDKTLHQWVAEIAELRRAERRIIMTGQQAGKPAEHFSGGYLVHSSGQIFTVVDSDHEDANTVLTLGHWDPILDVGDELTIYAGCRHTVQDCTDKFANAVNFGGFAKMPNKNPTIHGAVSL